MNITLDAPVTTKHILIIDDDDLIRILLRESFWIYSHTPVDIIAARSIAEARTKIHDIPEPLVIFVGLSLLTQELGSKRDTGPSLAFIAETKREKPHTTIIVYSKHAEVELKEKAKNAGADHYMVKGDYTPSELVDFVEHL